MNKVVIELTLKKHIWIDKDVWGNSFDEELPADMGDVEMLEDEAIKSSTELYGARFLGDWVESN